MTIKSHYDTIYIYIYIDIWFRRDLDRWDLRKMLDCIS